MKIAKKIFTLVCDDIRLEVDGRISLMGILDKDLVVDEIPYILPSLSIMISLEEMQTEISEINVILRAPKVGPEIFKFVAPPDKEKGDNGAKLLVKLAPFRIKSEGEVKVQIKLPDAKKAVTIHSFKIIQSEPLD